MLRTLQRSDRYHLAKHIAWHQGRDLPPAERPWWIWAHRSVAIPFRKVRRRLLVALGVRAPGGRAESEIAPTA
jgi:hypothetical protein